MRILIKQGDITTVKADMIVNAANRELRNGAGVCGAIYKAAGPQLDTWSENVRSTMGPSPLLAGRSLVSPSFDMKNCSKIIHTVGPIYNPQGDYNRYLLKAAYISAFNKAIGNDAKSIALPAISTGVYGYPMDEALEVVKSALLSTAYSGKVILVCFDELTTRQYKAAIKPLNIFLKRIF